MEYIKNIWYLNARTFTPFLYRYEKAIALVVREGGIFTIFFLRLLARFCLKNV